MSLTRTEQEAHDRATQLLAATELNRWPTEATLRDGLAQHLSSSGHKCRTEARLPGSGRIDILVDERHGIEVKIRHNTRLNLFKQLHRYANSGLLETLTLVTPQDVDWLRDAWRRWPQPVPLRIHTI